MTTEETVDARVVRRDRRIYLVLLTVLVTFVILLAMSLRENTEKAQSLQDELDVELWLARLRVPSEALYYDRESLSTVIEARAKLLTERGTESFLPYAAVALPSGTAGELPAIMQQNAVPAGNAAALFDASYELYWHTRSWASCEALANQIETQDGMGKWFLEHRDVFDTKIRPLVERILESYHPYPRRSACRVLLAMGDRNAALKSAVERLLNEPSELNEADRSQLREQTKSVAWQ